MSTLAQGSRDREDTGDNTESQSKQTSQTFPTLWIRHLAQSIRQSCRSRVQEYRTLLGEDPAVIPSWKHENALVRIPAKIARIIVEIGRCTYGTILIPAIPLAIAAEMASWPSTLTFIFSFLALLPLAAYLRFTGEELSAMLPVTVGKMVNATVGTVVELIITIEALRRGELALIQYYIPGSILSTLLLTLSIFFIASGIQRAESMFNTTVASTLASLLMVAVVSMTVPTVLSLSIQKSPSCTQAIRTMSHGTAVVLLCLYLLYLYFKFRSHMYLYDNEAQEQSSSFPILGQRRGMVYSERILGPISLSLAFIAVLLLAITCARSLISCLAGRQTIAHLGKPFIGIVLLPLIGNSAEYESIWRFAKADDMDGIVEVTVGNGVQISLWLAPLLVVLGWIFGQPLTLCFHAFEALAVFISVYLVNSVIADGKSNYYEGSMCLGLYVTIAVASFMIPNSRGEIGCAS